MSRRTDGTGPGLAWLDVPNGIEERIVLSGVSLDFLRDLTDGHSTVMLLVPDNHPLERSSFSQPAMRISDGGLVVRNEHPAFFGGLLEVDGVPSSLRISFHGTNEIPSFPPKQLDEVTVDVFVGVQREPPEHYRFGFQSAGFAMCLSSGAGLSGGWPPCRSTYSFHC